MTQQPESSLPLEGGKGKKPKRESPLPEGWRPDDKWIEAIKAERVKLKLPPMDLEYELASFTAHAMEHDRRASSWPWAFRRWCNFSKAAQQAAEKSKGKPARKSRWDPGPIDYSRG